MRIKPYPVIMVMLVCTLPVQADHLEELVVTASQDTRTIDVADELLISSDLAQLLKRAPGANVNSNGPLTGIPQYRGMYGSRIAMSMDGTQLAPSGPNWMDPPLSYAVGGQLESLKIYRGIVPVIDHDHGSAPGLIKHSEAQPVHPPIAYMELCNRTDPYNKGRKLRLDPKKAAVEATEIAEERFLCEVHGQCPNIGPDGKKTKEWDPSTVCTNSNQSQTRTCGLEPVLQCKLLQSRTVAVSNCCSVALLQCRTDCSVEMLQSTVNPNPRPGPNPNP